MPSCSVAQALEQRFGLVLVQHEAQVRQCLAKLGHDPGQQVRPNGGNQRQLEFAGKGIRIVAPESDDFLALVQHAACAYHDLLADFRELHVLRLALDQLDAEVVLELFELRGQGGLTHEGALGCLAEVAGIGQRHQVL